MLNDTRAPIQPPSGFNFLPLGGFFVIRSGDKPSRVQGVLPLMETVALQTLKEVSAEMQLNPQTAGRWLKTLKHKPTVNGARGGGYRFSQDNKEKFLAAWAAHKAKRKTNKRK